MSTRGAWPAVEPSGAKFEPAAPAAPKSRRRTGADSRFWCGLLVCSVLYGWSHAAFARGATHERHGRKIVATNVSKQPHRHTGHARVAERAAHGTHRGRSNAVAHLAHHQPEHHLVASTKPLIVIDPGHGGKDSGAIGRSGTLEKNVTLATALDLQRLLVATGRYRVTMTRSKDTFVPLGERLAYAQSHAAALLISIHADASTDRHAHGASVYIRSNHPFDATALPLVTSGSISAAAAQTSASVAPQPAVGSPWLQYTMIDNLDDDIRMTADPARQAHLYVLAAGDVPSVLLEMGFLSNRHDEALLKQQKHQEVVARAVRDAIGDYFDGLTHMHDSRT